MASNKVIHASWDGGAISEHPFLVAVLGIQKSIKTRCGKRVSMSLINNADITCGACLDEISRQAQALERIEQYTHVVKTQGIDAANQLAATWEVSK